MTWKAGLVVFLFAWTLTTHGKYSVSGDEPHYLMMTHSIVVDRDLDLANNYANNDGRFFGHEGLTAGLHAIRARTGHMRSTHNVGLAAVLSPVYAFARQIARLPSESLLKRVRMDRGLFTYSIVGLFLMALTAAGLVLLADGLSVLVGQRVAALLITAIGVSPPIVSHSFLVFPEVLALFCTAAVVWLTLKRESSRDRQALLAIALLLGALPWTHHKYLLYTPGLVFVLVWTRWALIRQLSWWERRAALAVFVVPQIALHVWMWREWGTLGGPITVTAAGFPFSVATLRQGVVGLWIDRQAGLLAYAPLYWIVPACWWLTRKSSWPYLVPAMLLFVPAASFTIGWWAGFSPAGRYLVPMIPLCTVAMAGALRHRAVLTATVALLVPQALIDAIVWQQPRTLWPATEKNAALELLGPPGRAYEAALPAVQTDGVTMAALWLGALALLVSVGLVVAARSISVPRLRQTPAP